MRTVSARVGEVKRQWHVVDATGIPLGRLAARVARVLQGKHRTDWTPHVDCGDFVVVVNCGQVRLSGRKAEVKEYQRYSGYPGGRKVIPYRDAFAKDPGFVVREATRRMLPKSRLGKAMIRKLKTFPGSDHNHQAQRPRPLTLS
jgi:large subunit ribosomal protein L13